jgi:4-hydroxy-4-methyl-2-oxoglutarate aldolase
MTVWKDDQELFSIIRAELGTCVVSDAMLHLGFKTPMLPPALQPLDDGLVMLGRAMPVQDELPVHHGEPARFDSKPYGLMFESIEDLQPNEIYIATGAPVNVARLGDMLVLRAQQRGATGIVLNACVRDVRAMRALGIPVFSRGAYAYGLQGRHNVVDFRCSIKIGDVRVRPGDLLFGDADGVCVIPKEAEVEIIDTARAKMTAERKVLEEISTGRSVIDVFCKYKLM